MSGRLVVASCALALLAWSYTGNGLSAQVQADSVRGHEDETAGLEEGQERLLEAAADASDEGQTSELLESYRRHPLNLNTATASELENLPGVSPALAHAMVTYRREQPFKNVRELLQVPGVTREIFVWLTDYVTVAEEPTVYGGSYRSRVRRSMDLSRDFEAGRYDGNAFQTYHRSDFYFRREQDGGRPLVVNGTILVEKDPGERSWVDHAVGHVDVRNAPLVRRAVVGHYQLEFGQALSLWGSRGLSKGSETIQTVRRTGRGLVPYRSAGEGGALLGVAATLDLDYWRVLRPMDVTLFYSHANYDASFNTNRTVNGLLEDGLHRDSSESARKDYVLETMGGLNVDYRWGSSSVGWTHYTAQYDHRFVVRDIIRSRYNFSGTRNRVTGLHYNIYRGRSNWFGEAALDRSGDRAFNAGWFHDFGPIETVVLYRNYSRSFQNLHGFAFGEQNGKTQNEEGLYTGVRCSPQRGTRVTMYYDIYRFPWRTFDVPRPVTGDDFFVQVEQNMLQGLRFSGRFKQERKDAAFQTMDEYGRSISVVEKERTRRLRYQLEYDVSREVRLRSRVEHVWYRVMERSGTDEPGVLMYEDVRIEPSRSWTVYGRVSVFGTESSHSAIYEYENDIDGVSTNAMFSGKGTRWYVMIRRRLGQRGSLAIKYWELYRDDVDEIGSGGDSVPGRVLRKVSMSLDMSF
jgi:competence ComEA-like helix-hairpin-helix protein